MYEQRNFMIFNTNELNKVDFSQVLETNSDTVRKNVDENLTFVKWDGTEIPSSIQNLDSKQGPYSYEEMLAILNTSDWTLSDID